MEGEAPRSRSVFSIIYFCLKQGRIKRKLLTCIVSGPGNALENNVRTCTFTIIHEYDYELQLELGT